MPGTVLSSIILSLSESVSHSVVSSSLQLWWPVATRLLCPWISPGKNTGVGSLFLLQGIFLTQDRTKVSPLAGGFFTIWATREAQDYVQMWRLQWVEFEDGPKLPAASCA